MKRTLPSIRIEEEMRGNIDMALKKININPLSNMTLQEFRRTAYEVLSQMILQDVKIPVKIK